MLDVDQFIKHVYIDITFTQAFLTVLCKHKMLVSDTY